MSEEENKPSEDISENVSDQTVSPVPFQDGGRRSGMHPGVVNGRRIYDKVNTAKRRSRARLERAIEGWDRHIENHPRDNMAIRSRNNCRDKLNGLG